MTLNLYATRPFSNLEQAIELYGIQANDSIVGSRNGTTLVQQDLQGTYPLLIISAAKFNDRFRSHVDHSSPHACQLANLQQLVSANVTENILIGSTATPN